MWQRSLETLQYPVVVEPAVSKKARHAVERMLPTHMEPSERTDIVIVGGGFGAMNAAVALDRRLKRGLKIEVTLISRSNFFLFTPLLAEVASSLVESRHAVSPIRRMLARVRFIEGTVQTVDPVRRRVAFVDQNE